MEQAVHKIPVQPNLEHPRISIVVPCYQHGRYLEKNLISLISQDYPNLELIVIDGGSTDGTRDILEKYDRHIYHWVSEPDRGQTDAILKGLQRASGEWFNWLNGDDWLLPGALTSLARISRLCPDANIITGARIWVSEEGQYVRSYLPWQELPWTVTQNNLQLLPQEATFLRLPWMKECGLSLHRELHNVMDTALYTEGSLSTVPVYTTAVFGAMQLHPDQKGRNESNLKSEYQKFVAPIEHRQQWKRRCLARLSRLPFGMGALLRIGQRLLLNFNLIQGPRFVIYSPQELDWRVCSSREWAQWL